MTGPSVPAIFAGIKTQTRRLMTPQPAHLQHHEWRGQLVHEGEHRLWCWKQHTFENLWDEGCREDDRRRLVALCPLGRVGDRLWVKEAWRTEERASDSVDGIRFAADNAFVPIENSASAADRWVVANDNGKHGAGWRSPLFMPRWASRLTLELVEVRVQRLQEISEDDARAEGVEVGTKQPAIINGEPGHVAFFNARDAFAYRWVALHGRDSWSVSPWVWALTFRRLP
jgi:hypothetical protein